MKALIIGSAMVDQMMILDRLPKSGEDVPCLATRTDIGGCAYNVAATLRNLDCAHDLCVPVGTGMYADMISEKLHNDGYEIMFKDEDMDNGYCLSLVEATGERTFITVHGAECDFRREWFDSLDLSEYDYIYTAGYQAFGENGKVLSDWLVNCRGKQVIFAPGPMILSIEPDVMQRILSIHPILHINDKEALDYSGCAEVEDAMIKIFAQNNNLVFVTLGAKGSVCYDGTNFRYAPSDPVEVVDTVGAGDSHIGALIGGMLMGMEPEEAMKLANKVAGTVVSVQGPVITRKEFEEKTGGYIHG